LGVQVSTCPWALPGHWAAGAEQGQSNNVFPAAGGAGWWPRSLALPLAPTFGRTQPKETTMTTSKSKERSQGSARNLFARLGPIEYRRTGELVSYPRKVRKHPERQLVALEAAIREFGFIVPLLVSEGHEIIAGDARLIAAKRAGLPELPVIRTSHLTAAQVKAFRIADNRLPELASWDEEALTIELEEILAIDEISVDLLGWTTAELDVLLTPQAAADKGDPADEIPEPPKVPVARSGDLWLLGGHRLLCGSSLEASAWERLMGGETARMAFTDPPYNVPVSGHVCGLGKVQHAEFAMASGEMDRPAFTSFLTSFLSNMAAHLADGAVGDICIDWRHLGELLTAVEASDLSLLNLCVWNKTNGGMGSLYRSKHELVLIAKKGRAPHINNVELGKHGRYRTNVWDYAGVNSFGRGRMTDLADHPTVKPIALVADAIRDVSGHGDIVLDAFIGSGTTLLAAERTGRRGYGIEIEPGYVDVAIRRWETITGGTPRLEDGGHSFAEIAAERLTTAGAQSVAA
jgi:DNA modification methylase